VTAGGVVLAGGRSTRMGSPKAWLAWGETTLLGHVVEVVSAGVDGGPVVVVSADGQDLPELPAAVTVVTDRIPGAGVLGGIATGLTALEPLADVAFAAATDLPFLQPDVVRRTLGLLSDEWDVVLPDAAGFRHPLAAAYRTALAPLAAELLDSGLRRPDDLYARCRVRLVPGDPAVLENVNDPATYTAARRRADA
jgi:molybdenum cofactor guanylyltransferase